MSRPGGVSLALRREWLPHVLGGGSHLPWVELMTDNHLHDTDEELDRLAELGVQTPIVLHGVGLNLGSVDPLDQDYLTRVAALAERLDAVWVSEHLCFTGAHGVDAHDLLPLPYTEEAVAHVAPRIARARELIGRELLVENVSRYLPMREDEDDEIDFVTAVLERSDCGLLLDVNNVFVNAHNLGFDPVAYIDALPAERIVEMHIAGHDEWGDLLVDSHGTSVTAAVVALMVRALERCGPLPVALERDRDIPPFEELMAERALIAGAWRDALSPRSSLTPRAREDQR